MNIKQFLSSGTFFVSDTLADFWSGFRFAFSVPIRLFYPGIGYECLGGVRLTPGTAIFIYLAVVLLCAGFQGVLSLRSGVFWPDPATERIEFLEDGWNLANYLAIVPLYVITGTGFILSLFAMEMRFGRLSRDTGMPIAARTAPLLSGLPAMTLLICLVILTQANYAYDTRVNAGKFFWFHGATPDAAYDYRGYFYIMVNSTLAVFVASVAILHLELFRWASQITRTIRESGDRMDDEDARAFWCNIDRIKTFFSPFTETAIWSKSFAVMLAINIYTWKESGVNIDRSELSATGNTLYFDLIFLIYVAIALWLVSLPRYRVQYEIFRHLHRMGIHEYRDVRMPWVLGWSAFVDFVLLAFLSQAILRGDLFGFLAELFS